MCFNVTKNQIKIAEKPIIVFKAICSDGSGPHYSMKDSKGNFLPYQEGNHYTERFNINPKADYVSGGCFHSCKRREDARGHGNYVYAFVIPTGAKYMENWEEYVSSDIIFPTKDQLAEYKKEIKSFPKYDNAVRTFCDSVDVEYDSLTIEEKVKLRASMWDSLTNIIGG